MASRPTTKAARVERSVHEVPCGWLRSASISPRTGCRRSSQFGLQQALHVLAEDLAPGRAVVGCGLAQAVEVLLSSVGMMRQQRPVRARASTRSITASRAARRSICGDSLATAARACARRGSMAACMACCTRGIALPVRREVLIVGCRCVAPCARRLAVVVDQTQQRGVHALELAFGRRRRSWRARPMHGVAQRRVQRGRQRDGIGPAQPLRHALHEGRLRARAVEQLSGSTANRRAPSRSDRYAVTLAPCRRLAQTKNPAVYSAARAARPPAPPAAWGWSPVVRAGAGS